MDEEIVSEIRSGDGDKTKSEEKIDIVTSSSVSVEKTEEKNENQINANVSPKCMNTNQCKRTNLQQQQQQQQQSNNNNKKNKNRRRKRSYRSRKNSGNFKFNPKGKKRDIIFNRDQARRRHELFFTDSQRLVPYNTNEFLMNEHYPKISPNFNYQPYNHDSFSSSDCGMSGSLDEDEFLTKEFRMDYENLRSEQLHEMTKEQLVQEYLKLENQTEMSMKAKENEIQALNNKIKGNELVQRRTGVNLYANFIFPFHIFFPSNAHM